MVTHPFASFIPLPNRNVEVIKQIAGRDVLIQILRDCYVKDYVSIGTLIRKLPTFLAKLCNTTNLGWSAHLVLDREHEQYVCLVSDPVDTIFTFRIDATSTIRRHGNKLLRDFFTKDKFYDKPHSYLKVQCLTEKGYVIYEKERNLQGSLILTLHIQPASFSLSNYVRQLMHVPYKVLDVK